MTQSKDIANRAKNYIVKLNGLQTAGQKICLEALKHEVTAIRKSAVDNLSENIEPTIDALEGNGFKVHLVYSLSEARKVLEQLVSGEKLIVKSKSNLVNRVLSGKKPRYKIVETDLGDFVADIVGSRDAHPVLPAVSLSCEEIAKKLKGKVGLTVKPTPEGIAEGVRSYLREKIYQAKVGLTGANAITADGSIVILENEGNISLITRCADTHISIVGVEKIVENIDQAMKISHASAVFGTNQYMASYVSVISGPSKTADLESTTITGAQGAKSAHVILVDTRKSIPDEFKSLLQCINCGACLSVCDAYLVSSTSKKTTGRRGKSQYKGIKYLAEDMLDGNLNASEVFKCSTCRACTEICPAGIPLRDIMIKLREYCVEKNLSPKQLESMIKNVRKTGNPFARKKAKIDDKLYCC